MSETTRRIRKILMDLHTIPTKTKGNTPLERVAYAETLIHQEVIRGKIEELEHPRVPPLYVANRLRELKADLERQIEEIPAEELKQRQADIIRVKDPNDNCGCARGGYYG